MDFVYSATEGMVLNRVAGGTVLMRRGDVWFADDPFVQSRPDLFSATPVIVHSTVGPQPPPPSLVTDQEPTPARRGRRG